MPNPHELQLIRVCSKPETLKRAKEILRLALIKTRPGSGYDLGIGASGLPPICAYIASQEVNNGDITQKVAQSASCLNDKVFARTLNVVRKAIADNGLPNKSVAMSYNTLVRNYTIVMVSTAVGWMEEAEKALVLKEVLPTKYDVNSPLVKCAVFFWVCKILKIPEVEADYLLEEYELSERSFDTVVKILDKNCDPVAKKIIFEIHRATHQKVAAKLTSTFTSMPIPPPCSSRKTRSSAVSPSKSAMKGNSTENSSPTPFTLKRVVSFSGFQEDDDDMSLPDTPTKKRKVDSLPTKASGSSSATNESLSAFRKAMSGRDDFEEAPVHVTDIDLPSTPSTPGPSTPRRTPRSTGKNQTNIPPRGMASGVEQSSISERTPSPLPQSRRFRPVFLDRKQWAWRDPRIAREWGAMVEHKRSMVDLYGHPLATNA